MLLYDLGEISERIELYGATVLGVLLVSSLIAFPALIEAARRSSRHRFRNWCAPPRRYPRPAITAFARRNSRATNWACWSIGFNEMLAGIQSRDNDLTKALQRSGSGASRRREGARAVSLHGRIDAAEDLHGHTRAAMWTTSTGNGWSSPDSRSSRSRIGAGPNSFIPTISRRTSASGGDSIETGEPFHFEHRFRRADGKYRWHLSRAHAMRDASGNISMWIGSNTDIHEQKEKEEELRRANDDLQQFAYSASHDLQEPIRNVAVYSEIVAKRYHERLDADGQQFLGFLTEGGRRLATLINDLLAYTRAGVMETSRDSRWTAAAVLQHTLCRAWRKRSAKAMRRSPTTRCRRCTWAKRTSSRFFRISSATRSNIEAGARAANPHFRRPAGGCLALFRSGQRHRHRSQYQGENLWCIQTTPSRPEIQRHRHRTGYLPAGG